MAHPIGVLLVPMLNPAKQLPIARSMVGSTKHHTSMSFSVDQISFCFIFIFLCMKIVFFLCVYNPVWVKTNNYLVTICISLLKVSFDFPKFSQLMPAMKASFSQ
jgi:hypothetical protein